MDNPEKLATSGTQNDKTKKNITKTQHNTTYVNTYNTNKT
jgi:hypothetical protein